jgi:uncharacterized repeat protein (TIGR03843 family)
MMELSVSDILELLQSGTMEVEGVLPWSSNYTFLVRVCQGELELEAVYKPRRGERPLWDFPQGTLCQRELAAFLVSEAIGWHIVPPTVLRQGQHGVGTVQLFIDHDPERHYFTLEGNPLFAEQLQQMALLDVIINNADRKGGHVLLQRTEEDEQPGRLWGIDHGICFHTDQKLRTVIWEFAGMPIPQPLQADLLKLRDTLNDADSWPSRGLAELLAYNEVRAVGRRLNRLIDKSVFPDPGPGRHYPWPPV